MSLKESVEKLHVLHGRVNKSNAAKFADGKKFHALLKALNKAKNGKAFDKIKNDAQKALEKVREDLIQEQDDAAEWAKQVTTAKADLVKARKDLKENKEGYEFNLKKCQDLNKFLKKYNETPEGKKKPEYLLPEVDPTEAMKDAVQAVDDAELEIKRQDATVSEIQDNEKKEKKVIERYVTELYEKKFKSAKK